MSEVRSLTVRRVIPASREELFDAWLDPESLAEWMRPGPMTTTAKVDPRVGGRYEIIMKAPDSVYPHKGEYRVIDRPSKLAFTWISSGTEQQETLVTVEFIARGDKTEVVLTHTGFPSKQSVENHTEGWNAILERLSEVLAPKR